MRHVTMGSLTYTRAAGLKLLCALALGFGVCLGWSLPVPDTIKLPDSLGPLYPDYHFGLRKLDRQYLCRERVLRHHGAGWEQWGQLSAYQARHPARPSVVPCLSASIIAVLLLSAAGPGTLIASRSKVTRS